MSQAASTIDDVPLIEIDLPSDGMPLQATIDALERQMIMQAVEHALGNKSRAAELLRMNRSTLLAKMRRLGMALNEAPPRRPKPDPPGVNPEMEKALGL